LGEAVDRLLERSRCPRPRSPIDERRVNLLTLHSTKGLEFSRVYIAASRTIAAGFHQLRDNRTEEIQEARRLLYVGMTRARDRLLLTAPTIARIRIGRQPFSTRWDRAGAARGRRLATATLRLAGLLSSLRSSGAPLPLARLAFKLPSGRGSGSSALRRLLRDFLAVDLALDLLENPLPHLILVILRLNLSEAPDR